MLGIIAVSNLIIILVLIYLFGITGIKHITQEKHTLRILDLGSRQVFFPNFSAHKGQKNMTFLSKIFTLFPCVHLFMIIYSIMCFSLNPSKKGITFIFLSIYFFPLICFRALTLITPTKEGVSDILSKKFSPWWAGHQIQLLLITLPWLEDILKTIPGCYSFWLRLWGSKIGKNIYWTPGTINYDRNLLEIGDNVIMGEKVITSGHIITPQRGKGLLKVARVCIGKRSFIGAFSMLAPGTQIEADAFIKVHSHIYPDQVIKKD